MSALELRLLACMLHQGDFSPLIKNEVTEDSFFTDAGKILFDFITSYKEKSNGAAKFPSLEIAKSRFKDSGIVELPELAPGDSVEALTHEVGLHRLRVLLQEISTDAEAAATNSPDPMEEACSLLTKLRKATEAVARSKHASLASSIVEIVERYDSKEILPEGVPWPWESLTRATRGMHKQEFYVIAGRPKARKTFTALHCGVHAVKHHHQRLLVFSPEMPVRQMLLRCVADFCELRYTEFKGGDMDAEEEGRLVETAEVFGRGADEPEEDYLERLHSLLPGFGGENAPAIDVVQSTGRDTSWMASQIEIFRPTIVICDSFYRQRPAGGKRNDADWKAVTAVSREMKDIAMDTGVILIGTHQLNRGAARNVGGLDNLGLADAVGADADGTYRVVTGKIEGEDVSAFVNLGGREVPFDGILYRNRPCHDYSEIGVITSMKQVEVLLNQEDPKEEEGQAQTEGSNGKAKNPPKRLLKSKPNADLAAAAEEDEPEADYDEQMVKARSSKKSTHPWPRDDRQDFKP